jgi:protein subunit release factor A
LEIPQQFRDLSVEYARLQPTAAAFADYRRLEQELASAQDMLGDADSDMRALGEEELAARQAAAGARRLPSCSACCCRATRAIRATYFPRDPRRHRRR